MKRMTQISNLFVIAVLALGLSGCNSESIDTTNNTDVGNAPPPDTVSSPHAHPHHGPHGGDLVELGNEDYHAEIVHGDDDSISFYILGGDAKSSVPIDATEVVINVSHDGKPEQFKVPSSPDKSDPEGKTSRFVSDDSELNEHLHEEHVQAKLVVVIDGKQFTGKIEHDHDAEHGHSHD